MPTINKLKKAPRKTENSENRVIRKKYYSSIKWKKLRLLKLEMNPLDEMDLTNNVISIAEDIHHIISPFSKDLTEIERNELFYDLNNLMSLTKVNHQKIHNQKLY